MSLTVDEHERHHYEKHANQRPQGGFFSCSECSYRSNRYKTTLLHAHKCTIGPPLTFAAPLPDWEDVDGVPAPPLAPPAETLTTPTVLASEFATSLRPMVINLAGQMRSSCTYPWAAMCDTFGHMADLVCSIAGFLFA